MRTKTNTREDMLVLFGFSSFAWFFTARKRIPRAGEGAVGTPASAPSPDTHTHTHTCTTHAHTHTHTHTYTHTHAHIHKHTSHTNAHLHPPTHCTHTPRASPPKEAQLSSPQPRHHHRLPHPRLSCHPGWKWPIFAAPAASETRISPPLLREKGQMKREK